MPGPNKTPWQQTTVYLKNHTGKDKNPRKRPHIAKSDPYPLPPPSSFSSRPERGQATLHLHQGCSALLKRCKITRFFFTLPFLPVTAYRGRNENIKNPRSQPHVQPCHGRLESLASCLEGNTIHCKKWRLIVETIVKVCSMLSCVVFCCCRRCYVGLAHSSSSQVV